MSEDLNKVQIIPIEQKWQNAFIIFLNVFCLQHAFAQSWPRMINKVVSQVILFYG